MRCRRTLAAAFSVRAHRRGSTTLFVAVLLMGILAASAFVIDAAAAYVTRARMLSIADAGADAGARRLVDAIVEYATARDPNPPDGTDPTTMLMEDDRAAILASARDAALDYTERNRAASGAVLDRQDAEYRYVVDCSSVRDAELLVTVRRNHPLLLGVLLNGRTRTGLTADALRIVRLCPP